MSEPGNGRPVEKWGSKIGVILAVAGSAVGLGNFLRFPGQAAANGGGAFMIPYFISFLLVGIPICWAEWTMGRYGGRYGFNSCPAIFSVLWRRPFSKYFGALGLLIPIIIYMYYVYLESWCLAYAYHYLTGQLELGQNPAAYTSFFGQLTGVGEDGAIFKGGIQKIFWFFVITFAMNFFLVYRGLNKGIETFCKVAMPMLILAAFAVVYQVLTLPEQPRPVPWQTGLAHALPAPEWNELKSKISNPQTPPEEVKNAVDAAVANYFEQLRKGTEGYDPETHVAPPAGYFGSIPGIAVAVAELRSESNGAEYRDWIERATEQTPDDVKLELQSLERQQSRLKAHDDTLHKVLLEWAGFSKEATVTIEDELAVITQRRAALLAELSAGPMPYLGEAIEQISSEQMPEDRLALQQRSAALELSERNRTVFNGLGYMWNPDFRELANPQVWLAAAGQIFFSLSVGFGIVLTYASYLRPNDDVVLSGLTASTMNEFCEVILGGLVAIPATFIFLGTSMTIEIINGSSLGLGFNALPAVFANMPAGRWFGALWFGLLFLAGVTSSLSMLQPAIAFFEEGFGLRRRASVAALGLLTISGSFVVLYFSKNFVALDTMDFWVGSLAIYILATIQIILFGWVFGVDRGIEEAHRGSHMTIPRSFRFIVKFVTPVYLLVIFIMWLDGMVLGYLKLLKSNVPALMTMLYIGGVLLFLALMVGLASEQWRLQGKGESEVQL